MNETMLRLPSPTAVAVTSSSVLPQKDSITLAELTKTLGSTVKHDDANKVITFLGMLLTYTEEDQINIGFLAESSTGKSYIPLELSSYFPSEDLIEVGYASPTAFFHDHSASMKPTKDKRREFSVDLHQKILIFIDQPHDLLLQRLRPILSHDRKTIRMLITDRNKNKNLRTSHILVQGYPTVIFASAKFGLSEQEKTRLLLLSPEVTQEKLAESISLKIKKESDRQAFKNAVQDNAERQSLIERIVAVKKAKIKHVVLPAELSDRIRKRFMDEHKKLMPRHQRDVSKLLAMIKANALLNFIDRTKIDDSILATQEDADAGFKLYKGISEANELGLSPELYDIYLKMKQHVSEDVLMHELGFTIADYQRFYETCFFRRINYDTARETLKTLVNMSLLTEQVDSDDRRTKRYLLFECVPQTEKGTQSGSKQINW